MVVPIDTRQPWWPLVATGATGSVWRAGKPLRTELEPRHGMVIGPDGAAMGAGRPLMGIRLDFRAVAVGTSATPGMRRRVQTALAKRMRG